MLRMERRVDKVTFQGHYVYLANFHSFYSLNTYSFHHIQFLLGNIHNISLNKNYVYSYNLCNVLFLLEHMGFVLLSYGMHADFSQVYYLLQPFFVLHVPRSKLIERIILNYYNNLHNYM